jgi:hypothetical protein
VIVRRREHLRDHDADPIAMAAACRDLPTQPRNFREARANWKSQMSSVIAAIQHRSMPQRPNV